MEIVFDHSMAPHVLPTAHISSRMLGRIVEIMREFYPDVWLEELKAYYEKNGHLAFKHPIYSGLLKGVSIVPLHRYTRLMESTSKVSANLIQSAIRLKDNDQAIGPLRPARSPDAAVLERISKNIAQGVTSSRQLLLTTGFGLHRSLKVPVRLPALAIPGFKVMERMQDAGVPVPKYLLYQATDFIAETNAICVARQNRGHHLVMDGGSCAPERMHDPMEIRTNVRLHAEVPLITLLGGTHFGITLSVLVLRTWWSRNHRGIHDGAGLHDETLSLQQTLDDLEQLILQLVFLEEVTEEEDRRFIGDTVPEQINAEEFLEGVAVVDGILHSRIRKVVPLLEKVDFEHEQQFLPLSARCFFWIVRSKHVEKILPGDDGFHLVQEFLASKLLLVSDREEGRLSRHELWGRNNSILASNSQKLIVSSPHFQCKFFRGSLNRRMTKDYSARIGDFHGTFLHFSKVSLDATGNSYFSLR